MRTGHGLGYLTIGIAVALGLAACGNAGPAAPQPSATAQPSPTFTPDPCAPEALPAQVDAIHRHMREFDDSFALAASIARDLLPDRISDLQRIRRETEDLRPPSCLQSLKDLQLVHMNTVIQTMLAFMNGADQAAVNQGLDLARQIHNQYMLELARNLGSTPAVAAVPPGSFVLPITGTGTPAATPDVPLATNNGPAPVNLRITPSLDGQTLAMLDVASSALALGQSADGFWIMVEAPGLPGQVAWVYSPLVQLVGPTGALPVVSP